MKYNEDNALTDKQYYGLECGKTQIVIGNTLSTGMAHVEKWKTVLNGESKFTAPFTISRDGVVHKHYDPKYYSNFVNIGSLDKKIIPITLENEGALWFNDEKKCYVNYIGDIYKNKGKNYVFDVKWRDRQYWAPYTLKQMNSLVKLCKELCAEFDIPLETVTSNTVTSMIQDFEGIAFRSNFSKYYYDVSPAFDVQAFKDKIEKK